MAGEAVTERHLSTIVSLWDKVDFSSPAFVFSCFELAAMSAVAAREVDPATH